MNAQAQTPYFTPGKLIVLQAGNGGTNQGNTPDDIFFSRQNPYFIDQFEPNVLNQNWSNITVRVAVPTTGSSSLWMNGNAGTEGNLALAGDKSVVTFGGYAGDICSIVAPPGSAPLAPSNIAYDRGIGQVDAFGVYTQPYRGPSWYGIAQGKTNPRGTVTDGNGRYWGCGNGFGSLYYDTTPYGPVQIQVTCLTSCAKIINDRLYSSVKSGETGGLPIGIYSFVDNSFNPFPYPDVLAFPQLEIATDPVNNQNPIGFDIDPTGTQAYVADNKNGIFKYIKNGLNWQLAYRLSIPGYNTWNTGTRTNAASVETKVGVFSVTVDWSNPTNKVVYATTADAPGADPRDAKAGSLTYYANRVIRIDDTNAVTTGATIVATTNILKTIVQAPVYNPSLITNGTLPNLYIVYKSVVFAPDLRPTITNNPANWSAAITDPSASFSVGATEAASVASTINYQWLVNTGSGFVDAGGVTGVSGQTTTSLSLNNASITALSAGATFECVVSNVYGAVTSSVASFTVSTASRPIITAQSVTNYVGNSFSVTAIVGGTDPKGGYQWYSNSVALSDDSHHFGTATKTLSFVNVLTNDAAVYQLAATNNFGTTNATALTLVVKYAPPAFVQPPANQYTFTGRAVNFTNAVTGYLLTNKWFYSSKTGVLTPVTIGGTIAQNDNYTTQPGTSALQISTTAVTDATNYVVIVSNPSGSITSAPVSLSLFTQPSAHTYASYTSVGQVYSNDFNTLPVPGGGSYEAGNPQNATFIMTNLTAVATNGYFGFTNYSTEIDYSIDNPVDFGYPVIANGAIGGFGLSNKLSGWYAWSQSAKKQFFGITSGDQSAAGVLDNGLNFNNINGYTNQTLNRALGLITSTASGYIDIALAIKNNTSKTNQVIKLAYIGELWRNNPLHQDLSVSYYIDDTGSSVFPTNAVLSSLVTPIAGSTVTFPTNTTQILDGTLPANQTSASVTGYSINDWKPGSTLWLIWQSSTSVGGAQNVAIDNVTLSATPTPVVISTPINLNSSPSYVSSGVNAGLHLSFSNTPGGDWQFTVWGSTNLTLPFSQWQNLGHPTEVSPGQYQFNDTQATNKPARFYRISNP
jgi:hypothetical protein